MGTCSTTGKFHRWHLLQLHYHLAHAQCSTARSRTLKSAAIRTRRTMASRAFHPASLKTVANAACPCPCVVGSRSMQADAISSQGLPPIHQARMQMEGVLGTAGSTGELHQHRRHRRRKPRQNRRPPPHAQSSTDLSLIPKSAATRTRRTMASRTSTTTAWKIVAESACSSLCAEDSLSIMEVAGSRLGRKPFHQAATAAEGAIRTCGTAGYCCHQRSHRVPCRCHHRCLPSHLHRRRRPPRLPSLRRLLHRRRCPLSPCRGGSMPSGKWAASSPPLPVAPPSPCRCDLPPSSTFARPL